MENKHMILLKQLLDATEYSRMERGVERVFKSEKNHSLSEKGCKFCGGELKRDSNKKVVCVECGK